MSFIKSTQRCWPAGTYVSASSISDSQSQLSNWCIFISNYSLIIFWTFIYSPIYLDVQTWELEQFTKRSQFVYNRMGGIYHEILPKSEYFSKALYTFHFAQNNLSVGYFTNKTTKQIEAYDPDPKERFTVAMQMPREEVVVVVRARRGRGGLRV